MRIRQGTLLILDVLLLVVAHVMAVLLKFGFSNIQNYLSDISLWFWAPIFINVIWFIVFDLYNRIWQNAGFVDYINIVLAFISSSITLFVFNLWSTQFVFTLLIIFEMIAFLFILSLRFYYRVETRLVYGKGIMKSKDKKRVLIIGAGQAASLVLKEIENRLDNNMEVLGLIDDDVTKLGSQIRGAVVMGSRHELRNIVESRGVDEVIFAIPSITTEEKKEIINLLSGLKVKVKTVPGVYEIVEHGLDYSNIRDVEIVDLLGRAEVKLNTAEVSHYIKNKTVLVTGGGGSIGSELCRQIATFSPEKLVVFDIYENNAYDLQIELQTRYPNLNLDVVIGSVRDRERLDELFEELKPQIIFHAAAHKHVPLMERSPSEAVKNNVFGTLNVGKMAIKHHAEKFILISTDKAVNPTNVMGATKRICEMIVQVLNKDSKTEFVAVRFGNVLGSNGSVIPLFKKQIEEGGPVTVTHRDITRYFMTIPEAVALVLQAGYYAQGGEIFILEMGKPVRIYELAENLIRLSGYEPNKDIDIKITGLRPGEKLFEELLMEEEGMQETPNHLIHIGKPIEMDEDSFRKQINQLNKIVCSDISDSKTIKVALSEIVDTYVIQGGTK